MKQNYKCPQVCTTWIDTESMIAQSVTMQRGEGSGGNTPEVKSVNTSSANSTPVEWESWE